MSDSIHHSRKIENDYIEPYDITRSNKLGDDFPKIPLDENKLTKFVRVINNE